MTATRDFLEATSNEFNQAVIRAKEAVTGQKSARIATRCRQVLEDAWTKYNTAYAQYAAKLKEPATKAEAQGVWLGEMRSYEVALDALEEYLEDQQGEPGNAQGDTAVLLAKEAVAAAVQEAVRRQGSLDAQLSKEMNTKQAAFLQEEIARMRRDLGNKLQAAYAGLIQASADADKVKAAKERAAELTEVNKKLDESLEVLRQQVRVEERATAPRADYIAESVTAAVDEDEDVDVDVNVDEVNMDEVNVDEVNVDEVNMYKVNVDEVNMNEVNKKSTMYEDSGEVCGVKEEMSKGKSFEIEAKVEVNKKSEEVVMAKPPEVPQRFDVPPKVQAEEFGMVEVKKVEMMKESGARVEVKKERESKRKGEENLERHEAQKDGVEEKTSAEEAETLTGSPKTAVQKKDEKDSKQLQKLKEEKEKESKGGKPQAQEEKKPEAVKEARPENEGEVEGVEEKNTKKGKKEKSKEEKDDKEEEIVAEVEVEQIGAKDVKGVRQVWEPGEEMDILAGMQHCSNVALLLMLLLGKTSTGDLDSTAIEDKEDKFTRRAALIDKLERDWWQMWYTQCFDSLFPFPKWRHAMQNLKVGDIVLFGSDSKVGKGDYRLARVCDVNLDDDGLARDVIVEYRPRRGAKGLPYTSKNLEKKKLPIQRLVLIQPIEAGTVIDKSQE